MRQYESLTKQLVEYCHFNLIVVEVIHQYGHDYHSDADFVHCRIDSGSLISAAKHHVMIFSRQKETGNFCPSPLQSKRGGGSKMSPSSNEKSWLYHRGSWSKIRNPLYDARFPHHITASRPPVWRQILREYNRKLCSLGPVLPPRTYSGILVTAYAYSGKNKVPAYLIRIVSSGLAEIIYVQDIPDLMEVLALLAPIVSDGIFAEAYMQGHNRA